jgi:SPP1 gp7 family putative phage head morphogenesis protein
VQIEKAARAAIRASGDPRAAEAFARTKKALDAYAAKLAPGVKSSQAAARSAADAILSAVRRGSEEAVDRAVKWWTWNREQDHQQLIARTETARAYTQAFVAAGREVPWVAGWEWNADDDPCPECQALHGTFFDRDTADQLPPLHPNCECFLTEVLTPLSDAELDAYISDAEAGLRAEELAARVR